MAMAAAFVDAYEKLVAAERGKRTGGSGDTEQ
jgi:hypothetical protein